MSIQTVNPTVEPTIPQDVQAAIAKYVAAREAGTAECIQSLLEERERLTERDRWIKMMPDDRATWPAEVVAHAAQAAEPYDMDSADELRQYHENITGQLLVDALGDRYVFLVAALAYLQEQTPTRTLAHYLLDKVRAGVTFLPLDVAKHAPTIVHVVDGMIPYRDGDAMLAAARKRLPMMLEIEGEEGDQPEAEEADADPDADAALSEPGARTWAPDWWKEDQDYATLLQMVQALPPYYMTDLQVIVRGLTQQARLGALLPDKAMRTLECCALGMASPVSMMWKALAEAWQARNAGDVAEVDAGDEAPE